MDPKTEDFFKTPEREGGPIDPLSHFKEVYEFIFYQTQNFSLDSNSNEPVLRKYNEALVNQSM